MSTPADPAQPEPPAEGVSAAAGASAARQTKPAPSIPPGEGLPKEGDILAGKYRIDRVLGQGGMGVVVAAHHTTLRHNVAIKYLLPEAAKARDAAERFLREARAAVSIQSEHVARVMDVGTLDTGAPYIVMELLTGSDLGDVLAERGALPVHEAVDHVLQACEAIAEAHALGIIHRDLKPANLFLTTRAGGSPMVKVLDFGLSKATKADAMDANLTSTSAVMGSPYYMSPEQIRSLKGLDARTDVWALGVILYQLLTGVRPFDGESMGGLFFSIAVDAPAPLRSHRPELPEALEATVLKCLEKETRARTQTVAELARGLAPFGSDGARLSVERIHRVLSDVTPLSAAKAGVDEAPERAVAERDSAAASSSPATSEKVKSSTMAAVAKDGALPSVRAPDAKQGRSGFMVGLIAAVVLGAIAVALFGLRGPAKPAAPAADLPATTRAPVVAPLPPLQATAAPTVPVVTPAATVDPMPATASATAAIPAPAKPAKGASAAKGPAKPSPAARPPSPGKGDPSEISF